MKTLRLLPLCALTLFCLTSCGLTLGPVTEKHVVILKPGTPMQIIENRTLKGLAAGQAIEQEVGGWYVMPPEHFDALMRAVNAAGKPEESGDETPERPEVLRPVPAYNAVRERSVQF